MSFRAVIIEGAQKQLGLLSTSLDSPEAGEEHLERW
jgi:hypothetical protein